MTERKLEATMELCDMLDTLSEVEVRRIARKLSFSDLVTLNIAIGAFARDYAARFAAESDEQ